MDETIRINLIGDQPLYSPPEQVKFKKQPLQDGKASGGNELLYEQFEINIPQLKDHIRQLLLKKHAPVSLPELIKEYPVEKGIAEVVAYLDIASKNEKRCSVSSDEQEQYEVNRIIKAFVNADQVSEWLERYKEYVKQSKK